MLQKSDVLRWGDFRRSFRGDYSNCLKILRNLQSLYSILPSS